MKKNLYYIVCLCNLISIMLCACGKQHIGMNIEGSSTADVSEENTEAVTLKATILELDDTSILVKPLDGSPELNSADKINIPIEGNIDLHIGDEIEIEYSGGILESYPAQLGAVYNIKVTKEAVDFQADQSSQQEKWDLIPMVMVDGILYLDTGYESTIEPRCGMMDGKITSEVDGSEKPTINNQSNFGIGYGYQYGETGTIEIFINETWRIFATEEVRQEIQFPTKP